VKAVEIAYSRRDDPRGLIFHSDKGSQYAGEEPHMVEIYESLSI